MTGGAPEHSRRVELSTSEVVSVRDAQRKLGALLDQLADGEIEKIVLTRRNALCGVIESFDRWAAKHG